MTTFASDDVLTLISESLEMTQLQTTYPALATAAGRDAFFDNMIKESTSTTAQQEDNIMQTAIAETNAQRQGK